VSERARIQMTADEVAQLLADGKKVQVATVNPDGTPHLVTLFYGLVDGKIAFFTYRRSQKARNLGRDHRLTCLVETGDDYGELRGVLIYGTARLIEDYAAVVDVGTRVMTRTMGVPGDAVAGYVGHTARKRVAYIVEPVRVVSWDHRKLAGPPASATGPAAFPAPAAAT
jgi:nitroimidazol reductase NimA-like FMN-containing flavoprotein (pyridoxamine 5'-phosphate oxidase superfamily)